MEDERYNENESVFPLFAAGCYGDTGAAVSVRVLFPVVLSGLSAVIFPSQANGSLVTADGEAVGAANVGQDFTEPYFMKCRPSAYNYNTYYEDADGNQFYNDGSEFAGLSPAPTTMRRPTRL